MDLKYAVFPFKYPVNRVAVFVLTCFQDTLERNNTKNRIKTHCLWKVLVVMV